MVLSISWRLYFYTVIPTFPFILSLTFKSLCYFLYNILRENLLKIWRNHFPATSFNCSYLKNEYTDPSIFFRYCYSVNHHKRFQNPLKSLVFSYREANILNVDHYEIHLYCFQHEIYFEFNIKYLSSLKS